VRILIADDEPASRRLMEMMLSPYGQCDLAANGMEPVQMFEMAAKTDRPYDLVCLDIMMPGMDGQEALKKIRTLERDSGVAPEKETKIIMITCLDSPSAVIEAYYRGGCTSYLIKPCSKNKLLATLRDFDLIP